MPYVLIGDFMKKSLLHIISSFLPYKLISVLFVVNCSLLIGNCYGQWTQLPNLPVSGTVYDMYFANANTGWVTLVSPTAIIKTTNGGQTWVTQSNISIRNIQFIDTALGYGQGFIGTNGTIWKTTNGGVNWNSVLSDGNGYADISFVNKDTGWVCGFDGTFGGVWRTIDGGNNWVRQYTSNSNGLDKIFFLKNKVNGEYWGWTFKSIGLFKTTNSGVNWAQIPNNLGSGCADGVDMYFIDTARGIITRGLSCFSKTTNGGYNWTNYQEFASVSSKIGIGDSNKFWLTLGTEDSLIKTTNFFQTYGKQVTVAFANNIFAIDTSTVYAGRDMINIMKTTNGGGVIIYLGIDSANTIVPATFSLQQNYPNPFNPQTTIKFSLSKSAYVTLRIYDLTGKEVVKIYNNEYLRIGNYRADIDFGKLNVASGVYFYELEASDIKTNMLYKDSKKLVYTK